MKRTLSRTRLARLNSFTLVELLVVMGIIAILASILIVAASSAINAAKRTRAATIQNQIQAAVLNYYTEYSVYPLPAGTAADVYYSSGTSDLTSWENLTWALCGNVNAYTGTAATSTVANTRAIAYLSPRKSDVDANGVFLNPIGPTPAATPYFNIAIDGNYDGILGNNGTANNKIPNLNVPTMDLTNVVNAGAVLWVNNNANSSSTNANFYTRVGF